MPFDLRITITGLCLFVPDSRTKHRLHVLLIDHEHHRHYPKLIYDKAHTNSANDKLACRNLDGVQMTFGDYGDVITGPVTLDEIVDLDVIAGVGKLDPRFVDGDPRHEVAARITLNAGQVTRIGRSADWIVRKDSTVVWEGKITTEIDWTIRGIEGSTLKDQWNFVDLGTNQTAFGLELHPLGTPPLVEVSIYNSLLDDLPPFRPRPLPAPGEEAPHFDGFYRLYEEDVDPVVPILKGPALPIPGNSRRSDCKPSTHDAERAPSHAEHEETDRPRSERSPEHVVTGHTATCIMAQGAV